MVYVHNVVLPRPPCRSWDRILPKKGDTFFRKKMSMMPRRHGLVVSFPPAEIEAFRSWDHILQGICIVFVFWEKNSFMYHKEKYFIRMKNTLLEIKILFRKKNTF
jgi:hypothetical protein